MEVSSVRGTGAGAGNARSWRVRGGTPVRELGWISVQRREYEPWKGTTGPDEMAEDSARPLNRIIAQVQRQSLRVTDRLLEELPSPLPVMSDTERGWWRPESLDYFSASIAFRMSPFSICTL